MPTVYKKRYPKNPLSLSTGKPLRFEDTGDNLGFLVTDDATTIAELNRCIAEQRGGVSTSTQAEYDEAIKKKQNSPVLRRQSIDTTQTSGLIVTAPVPEPVSPAVAAVEPTPAIAPPAEPRVGKRATK